MVGFTTPGHSLSQRGKGWNLKVELLADPHSITSDQGGHLTAKEAEQEPWRVLRANWLTAVYTQLVYTVQDRLPREGTAHSSRLGSTSMNNQDNPSQMLPSSSSFTEALLLDSSQL